MFICLLFCLCILCVFQIQSPDAQSVRGVPQAKARGLYSSPRDSTVMKFCVFLHDVLGHLSKLSATLQMSAITLAEAHSSLLATQAMLEKYKTRFVTVIILLFDQGYIVSDHSGN